MGDAKSILKIVVAVLMPVLAALGAFLAGEVDMQAAIGAAVTGVVIAMSALFAKPPVAKAKDLADKL